MAGKRDWKSRAVGEPEPGYFLIRLVRKGPHVPAQICHGDGVWSAVINGEQYAGDSDPARAAGVFRIWHSGEEITATDYLSRLRQSKAAKPGEPLAEPGKPINLSTRPPLF